VGQEDSDESVAPVLTKELRTSTAYGDTSRDPVSGQIHHIQAALTIRVPETRPVPEEPDGFGHVRRDVDGVSEDNAQSTPGLQSVPLDRQARYAGISDTSSESDFSLANKLEPASSNGMQTTMAVVNCPQVSPLPRMKNNNAASMTKIREPIVLGNFLANQPIPTIPSQGSDSISPARVAPFSAATKSVTRSPTAMMIRNPLPGSSSGGVH